MSNLIFICEDCDKNIDKCRCQERELIKILEECASKSRDLNFSRPHLNWGFQGVDTTEIADAYDKFCRLDNLYYLNTTHLQLDKIEDLRRKTTADLREIQKKYHPDKYFNKEILKNGTRICCHSTMFGSSSGMDYVITHATKTKLEGYFICGDHTGEVKKINTKPNLIEIIYV